MTEPDKLMKDAKILAEDAARLAMEAAKMNAELASIDALLKEIGHRLGKIDRETASIKGRLKALSKVRDIFEKCLNEVDEKESTSESEQGRVSLRDYI